jgi:hypothetical protein
MTVPDPIPALIGMKPVRLRVQEGSSLEAVEIEIANGETLRVVLATDSAIDLALRLIGACNRLARREGGAA